jgi:hypothetical protein
VLAQYERTAQKPANGRNQNVNGERTIVKKVSSTSKGKNPSLKKDTMTKKGAKS